MNMKELEAAVVALQKTVNDQSAVIKALRTEWDDHRASLNDLHTRVAGVLEAVTIDLSATKEKLQASEVLVDDLRMKVEGRNRSAPVKRNMTDDDALRVLSGDLSSLGHKEAAEKVGLTYAQVYSCRLGFTFKHVIKELEKGGWRSQWARG